MNIQEIKEKYTCLDYLGDRVVKKVAGGYLARAPWREDLHPSLSITANGKGWVDFATGEHGSVIDLVMKCLNTTDIRRACEELERANPSFSFPQPNSEYSGGREKVAFSRFDVVKLQSKGLFAYLHSRCVNIDIAKQFLQEAHYSFRNGDGYLYALAYPNDKGGYELRSSFFKGGTSPKGISTHLGRENAPTVVFEGFFDMLSFATLCGGVKHNYVVLNSIVNKEAALEVLKALRSQIYLCLDNDEGGESTTRWLLDALPSAKDIRSRFASAKDVNEYLTNRETKKMDKEINEKWQEVLDYATQHATNTGLHKGVRWLEDSFNEYVTMAANTVYGGGGQPGSIHNREVLAQKVLLELGHHIGGAGVISENQEAKLKATLKEIVDDQSVQRGLKIT